MSDDKTPAPKAPTERPSDLFERTVVTQIEKVDIKSDEKAYILFISGPLIGKMVLLEEQETTIGRSEDAIITVSDARVSRKHVKIALVGGEAYIEDMGSTNGTFINGQRVKRQALKNGDKVHVSSDTLFKFAVGDAAERMFQEEMHQMANYDAVTGILNKQAFQKRFREEFSFAKRTNAGLSLLMLDIDFFKKVNDTYGHMAGDHILHGVAQRVQNSLRNEDILARYGGEEFVVILRSIPHDGAVLLAERIRAMVAESPFTFETLSIPVTISLGAASLSMESGVKEPKDLMAIADERLYASKKNGRNRVTSA